VKHKPSHLVDAALGHVAGAIIVVGVAGRGPDPLARVHTPPRQAING
jgi:hypothetical protein